MSIMEHAKRVLLYGGLTKDQFNLIHDDVVRTNHTHLLGYAPIASIAFCVLLIISRLSGGFASGNQFVYVGSCAAMGVIALCAHACKHVSSRMVAFLSAAFMCVLYAFSLSVSINNPQYPLVSSIVFLMLAPLLFVVPPVEIMVGTVVTVIANCLASLYFKAPQIAVADAWNLVSYGIVAMVTIVFVMGTKFKALYQAYEISYLSDHDALTGLRNRNSYEKDLKEYDNMPREALICAYADANGLHQLNNTRGHEAGDKMLREIAYEMRTCFGHRHTYRVGGDEFVAFCEGDSLEHINQELEQMRQNLLKKGYHVSFGASQGVASSQETNGVRSLVRDAEKEMYAQKNAYYELVGAR